MARADARARRRRSATAAPARPGRRSRRSSCGSRAALAPGGAAPATARRPAEEPKPLTPATSRASAGTPADPAAAVPGEDGFVTVDPRRAAAAPHPARVAARPRSRPVPACGAGARAGRAAEVVDGRASVDRAATGAGARARGDAPDAPAEPPRTRRRSPPPQLRHRPHHGRSRRPPPRPPPTDGRRGRASWRSGSSRGHRRDRRGAGADPDERRRRRRPGRDDRVGGGRRGARGHHAVRHRRRAPTTARRRARHGARRPCRRRVDGGRARDQVALAAIDDAVYVADPRGSCCGSTAARWRRGAPREPRPSVVAGGGRRRALHGRRRRRLRARPRALDAPRRLRDRRPPAGGRGPVGPVATGRGPEGRRRRTPLPAPGRRARALHRPALLATGLGVDGSGTAWVADAASGSVLPFRGRPEIRAGEPLFVGGGRPASCPCATASWRSAITRAWPSWTWRSVASSDDRRAARDAWPDRHRSRPGSSSPRCRRPNMVALVDPSVDPPEPVLVESARCPSPRPRCPTGWSCSTPATAR